MIYTGLDNFPQGNLEHLRTLQLMYSYKDELRMMGRVRTEPRSALGVARSTLLIYEEEAVAKGTDMPFRPIDQRFFWKECTKLLDPFLFL